MKKLESSLKNMVLSLTIISVVSGGLLGMVNKITAEPIERAKVAKLNAAIAVVVPGFDDKSTSSTDTLVYEGKQYVVYSVTKDGEFIGAAVESESMGFGGPLKILVGFDKEGKIADYSLLSHSETPGLGSKADTWFKKGNKGSIVGKLPDPPLKVTKDNGDIDAITASTITSRAFLNAVNNAYAAYKQEIQSKEK